MGILWMVRMICQFMYQGDYKGEAFIYSHREILDLIRDIAGKLLQEKEAAFIDKGLQLVEVSDGERMNIIGHEVGFFDIGSTKAKQYGFFMEIEREKKIVCCGDEPLKTQAEKYAAGCEWLLHEAFCLDYESDIFHPYEKHHCTVKDACETAERLGAKNLILYHTEDKNLTNRKTLYKEEGLKYYHGSLYIPDDLETIEL